MDEFVLPEDLSTLTGEELAALETQAVEAFDEVRTGDLDARSLEVLTQLAEAVDVIRAEGGRRSEEQAQATAAVEQLVSRIHGEEAGAEAAAEVAAEGGEGEGDGGAAAPADEDEEEGGEGAAADAPEGAGELVTAAAGSVPAAPRRHRRLNIPLSEVRKKAPPVEAGREASSTGIVITAAADIPGVPMETEFKTLGDVAKAMHGRARLLGDGGKAPVATMTLPVVNDARDVSGLEAMERMLDKVTDVDTMVAAGGWCAPSQPIYDLFSIEGTDGLFDVPSMTIDRGGIEFPVSPSIASVFSAPWLWTEAMDIAAADNPHEDPDDDVVKPCFRIPCPTFDAERLDAHGLCISHGNLSDRAYPELTTRYIAMVTAAHLHLISMRHLAAAVSGSTAVAIPQTGGNLEGAAAPLLNTAELAAIDYRLKFRMRDDAVLEAVYPVAAKGIIRADLALRSGMYEFAVTDAMIAEWFDLRGLRVQFVQDWQSGSAGYLGQAAAATGWQDNVKFLLYAAGTWVEGQGGSIDLGVTRDSRQIETNDHTAAWTEEFRLLAKIGHESRVYTVPTCVNGAAKLGVNLPCVGADAP